MAERVKVTKQRKVRVRRAKPNRMTFTDLGIRRLKVTDEQVIYWDKAQKGLSLLVSPGGTKTFRASYKLDGAWYSAAIGRFGEMVPDADPDKENLQIGAARTKTANYRALARQGVDPTKQQAQKSKASFESVVDDFIEQYAKPRQRSWDQTEATLKNNCKDWLPRPITSITGQEVRTLLRGYVAAGLPRKAGITRSWLKTLWKWAYHEDKVDSPLIRGVDNVEIEKGGRERSFSDDEIKAIWATANGLNQEEGAFIKLLILLAPRKTALALMRHSDIKMVPLSRAKDAEKVLTWTTPFESTKSKKNPTKKRVYLTPLPKLAQRIIKGLPKAGNDRLFPSLRVRPEPKSGQLRLDDQLLKRRLKAGKGVPDDFFAHAMRHTVPTWLQDEGYSEYERGLILNHSGSGTVTDVYSHGYPLALKLMMLERWAAHIESIVGVKGAALLR